ncbi:MAG: hypothetical protein ACYDA6_10560 [Solirubrobacteraceae bacterium]
MHLITYLLHYIFARWLFHLLVSHHVAPLSAFLIIALVLYALRRHRHPRRRRL